MRRPFQVYGMDPVPEKSLLERWQEFKQRDRRLWVSRSRSQPTTIQPAPAEDTIDHDAQQRPASSRRNW
jgi:hypothetical protein